MEDGLTFLIDLVVSVFTDFSSFTYFLGILFTVIGVIVLFNVEQTHSFIGALCVALVGLIILFFRIRKDVIEIRDDIKGK
jgi:hypothetical protein